MIRILCNTAVLPALILLAQACSLHTINKEQAPLVAAPEHYSITSEASDLTDYARSPWWESFNQPELNTLITQALPKNFDIKQAAAAWSQAKAIAYRTGTEAYPNIDIEGGASIDSEDRNLRTIGAALSWDTDITGRIASAAYADASEALAKRYNADAVTLAVSADIAEAYFGAVSSHARIALLNEQIDLSRNFLRLLRLRFENGVGTSLDILRKESQLAENVSLIPLAEADLRVFEHRLDVLTGNMPDAVARVSKDTELILEAPLPRLGVPATLLLNRPDLKALRAELIAADADIAVAIADRLPRLVISGAYSEQAGFGFQPVSILTASFVQPLLDWGRRKAETVRAKALYEERLSAYTQLFLQAVEAVENALVREEKQKKFIKRLSHRRDLLQRIVNDAEERYKQGIDDYLGVITALQELRTVERMMITECLNLLTNRIALFRAIGGPVRSQPKTHAATSRNTPE